MNTVLKTLAAASLMGTVSAPAFAGGHMSTSMTCAEWKALGAEDQLTVAQMAVAEIEAGADGGSLEDDGAKSDEPMSEGMDTDGAEADTGATGSLEGGAASDEPASEPMNSAAEGDEALEQFTRVCDRNLDAMVSEAAAGLPGTR